MPVALLSALGSEGNGGEAKAMDARLDSSLGGKAKASKLFTIALGIVILGFWAVVGLLIFEARRDLVTFLWASPPVLIIVLIPHALMVGAVTLVARAFPERRTHLLILVSALIFAALSFSIYARAVYAPPLTGVSQGLILEPFWLLLFGIPDLLTLENPIVLQTVAVLFLTLLCAMMGFVEGRKAPRNQT